MRPSCPKFRSAGGWVTPALPIVFQYGNPALKSPYGLVIGYLSQDLLEGSELDLP